jgi:predicted aldo/keto reductase-like oxidoreductase
MTTRRSFISKGILTAFSAGMTLKGFSILPELSIEREQKFIYDTLGGTGIRVPKISLGTGITDNPNLVREALNRGIKLYTTSEYAHNGNNEKMLGEVFKDYPRDSFLILTGAVGGIDIDHANGLFGPKTDSDKYYEAANGCLKRLQLDHVDIFNLGFAGKRESVFFEPILNVLEKLKQQGKARFLSVSTHKFEPEAIRAAADAGIFDMVMTSYNFRKMNLSELNEAIDYAASKGLGVIAMKTMAGVYWDKERTRMVNTKAALKWVLQNDKINTTVPGCTSFDQLYQNLSIMDDLEMTEQEKIDLQEPTQLLSNGIYCQQCGNCLSQCPKHLDIPSIMRSYMYAYGYKDFQQSREALLSARLPDNPCGECEACFVKCSMGFDIKSKIQDILPVRRMPSDLMRI